jgi:putative (di)nucleoside polyphosphate hydrolase
LIRTREDLTGERLYRPNVGVALFNTAGSVLIARRIGDDGPEIIWPGFEWQMPQGGVDPNEDQAVAARRELWEETGIVSAELLGQLSGPVRYDFPPYQGPPHKLSPFVGQEQLWFAMRFTGAESEIDVSSPRNDEEPEFSGWRWAELDELPALVVPYKRDIYRQITQEFRVFAARS